jgi:hypothetical protein
LNIENGNAVDMMIHMIAKYSKGKANNGDGLLVI